MIDVNEIAKGIKEKIAKVQESHDERSTGRIVYSGDGIIRISGISDVKYNELLDIKGGYHALALNLEQDLVGAVLFSGEDKVRFGDYAYSTGRTVDMQVGEELIGRVVNPLGEALDGLGELHTGKSRPVEYPAPSIMDRGKVNKPLQTWTLALSMSVIDIIIKLLLYITKNNYLLSLEKCVVVISYY